MKNFIIAVLILALGGTVYYYQFMDATPEEEEVVDDGVEDLKAKLEEFKESSTVGEAPEQEGDEEEEEDDDESDEDEEEVEEESEPEEDPGEAPEEEEEVEEHFITLTSPDNKSEISTLPIVFTGKLSAGVTKIVVTAEGGGAMESYKDVYTLQDFKKGDTTFAYRAKPAWDNLMPGLNEYEFVAHFEDGETESAYISIYYEE